MLRRRVQRAQQERPCCLEITMLPTQPQLERGPRECANVFAASSLRGSCRVSLTIVATVANVVSFSVDSGADVARTMCFAIVSLERGGSTLTPRVSVLGD